jgi:hypothetical protein
MKSKPMSAEAHRVWGNKIAEAERQLRWKNSCLDAGGSERQAPGGSWSY